MDEMCPSCKVGDHHLCCCGKTHTTGGHHHQHYTPLCACEASNHIVFTDADLLEAVG